MNPEKLEELLRKIKDFPEKERSEASNKILDKFLGEEQKKEKEEQVIENESDKLVQMKNELNSVLNKFDSDIEKIVNKYIASSVSFFELQFLTEESIKIIKNHFKKD